MRSQWRRVSACYSKSGTWIRVAFLILNCRGLLSGIPAHELEAVTEQFNKVWNEMRSSLQGTDDWIGLSRASGLSKDDLVGACQKLSHVRDFFERRLTRRSPQVGETHHTSFQVRLRELQAEVIKESRAEGEGTGTLHV